MTTPENRVVLFVDLLGFAWLTEKYPLDLDAIKHSQSPLGGNLDELLTADRNPLTRAFIRFHHTMKWAIEFALMSHPLTAITFSDSAFIATTTLSESVAISTYILQSLLQSRVPARMGIAYGKFSAVRFRSDVSLEGSDHSAHFLGTGVVRSYAAEGCGIKGIRILLHPSAAALLADPSHIQSKAKEISIVECAGDECINDIGVKYEIDYWRFKPTAEAKAWHALQDMWSVAPPSAHPHYEATAQAVNRMRVSQGAPSLSNMRRRTLPRKSM